MDSKDIKNLFEAYTAVYDEDLRDEIEYASVDEDLSFVDDLSDNELTQIMEEIFDETEITLDECVNSLGFYLSEARTSSGVKITRGGAGAREKRAQTSTARVTAGAGSGGGFDRARRAEKTSERQQKVRIGRLAQAAQTAAEYPGKQARRASTAVVGGARAAAARANTLAGGAASAAAGGAAEAGRKIQSAKEKVKGFLGKVGRAVKAGASAAKKEFSGEAGREAAARTTGRQMRRAARKQSSAERAKDTSAFTAKSAKPSDPWEGSATKPSSKPSVTTKSTKALSGSSARAALPAGKDSVRKAAAEAKLKKAAAGSTAKGIRFAGERVGQLASQRAHTGHINALEKFRKRVGIGEEQFNLLLDYIFEDLVHEGYVNTYEDVFYVLESLSDHEIDEVVESYLFEEVETLDLYDVVLEHLLDEGYAETIEDAEVIMVNMSEDWRDEILESKKELPKEKIEKKIEKKMSSDSPKDWYNAGRMIGATGVKVKY